MGIFCSQPLRFCVKVFMIGTHKTRLEAGSCPCSSRVEWWRWERVEVHATPFLSPVLMGFDEICELGSFEFLSIDVQLGQSLFIL